MSEAASSGEATVPAPAGPGPPLTRRTRWGRFLLGAFFHGLGLLVVIYVSGLLLLLGDYRVELYVLLGVVFGGLLFPLVGTVMARTLRRPQVFGLLMATAGVLGLTATNVLDPWVADTDLLLRSMLCTVMGVPVAIEVVPRCARDLRSRRTLLLGMGLGLGPIVMGVLYSLLYVAMGFEGFAFLVLFTEVPALVLLLLLLGAGWRGARRGPRREQVAGPAKEAESVAEEPGRPGTGEARTPASGAAPLHAPSAVRRGLPGRARATSSGPAGAALLFALLLLLPNGTSPGVGGGGGAGGTPGILHSASPTAVLASPRTPIQHVVLVMFENHAFDSLFGLYPYIDRPAGAAGTAGGVGAPAPGVTVPNGLANASDHWGCSAGVCGPAGLTVVANGSFSTADPYEGYSPYHIDWDGGRMDGWLAPGGSGAVGLSTLGVDQMAPEWALAQEYAMGDAYYASMLTETTPNRLYSLAGFSPVFNDYGPPPYVPYDQTIFSELDANGLDWGYYLDHPAEGLGTLDFISGMSSHMDHVRTYGDFASEAAAGTLPPVTWLMPVDGGLTTEYSQGPPGNVLEGEMWLLYMLGLLMASPSWGSTAIVITYDEGGGYYDHVAPPVLDGEQLGNRVPLLVISPYAKEDYVSHTEMNHASWLAFVEYNWGLPALNAFVAASNLPLDLFDLTDPPRAPRPFTPSQGFPVPSSVPFTLPSSPDLAPLFPQPFQENLSTLPYARTGASDTTLGGMGSALYVSSNFGETPWYVSVPFLAWMFLVEVALFLAYPVVPRWLGRRDTRTRAGPRG